MRDVTLPLLEWRESADEAGQPLFQADSTVFSRSTWRVRRRAGGDGWVVRTSREGEFVDWTASGAAETYATAAAAMAFCQQREIFLSPGLVRGASLIGDDVAEAKSLLEWRDAPSFNGLTVIEADSRVRGAPPWRVGGVPGSRDGWIASGAPTLFATVAEAKLFCQKAEDAAVLADKTARTPERRAVRVSTTVVVDGFTARLEAGDVAALADAALEFRDFAVSMRAALISPGAAAADRIATVPRERPPTAGSFSSGEGDRHGGVFLHASAAPPREGEKYMRGAIVDAAKSPPCMLGVVRVDSTSPDDRPPLLFP